MGKAEKILTKKILFFEEVIGLLALCHRAYLIVSGFYCCYNIFAVGL